jgi:hypothetical protein
VLLALIITVFRGWWKGKDNAKKSVLPVTNSTPKRQVMTDEMSGVTIGGRGTWSDSWETLSLPPPVYSDNMLEMNILEALPLAKICNPIHRRGVLQVRGEARD